MTLSPNTRSSAGARPGFVQGALSVVRGLRTLLRLPELWPKALVPALILALLEGLFVWAGVSLGRPWVLERLSDPERWYGGVGAEVAGVVVVVLCALLGWTVALALAPPLSAPALESIVKRVERELGLPARPELGFWRETSCGFRAMAGAALIGVPLLATLWLLELVFPPAAVVLVPLKLVLGSLLLAWSLFDYPLTLRGIGFRQRLRFVRAQARPVLGFGAGFTLLFWVPCCGVVLLPVGVVAATELFARIERA